MIVYTWTEFNVEPQGQISVGDDCVLVGAIFMCAERIRVGRRVVISYHVTIADSDFIRTRAPRGARTRLPMHRAQTAACARAWNRAR